MIATHDFSAVVQRLGEGLCNIVTKDNSAPLLWSLSLARARIHSQRAFDDGLCNDVVGFSLPTQSLARDLTGVAHEQHH
jgi:hypothetical protein